MKTPKALAAEIAMERIRTAYDSEELIDLAVVHRLTITAVRRKLAAIHNQISKDNKLKERLDEV